MINYSEHGFTLIEITIVLFIVGLLIAGLFKKVGLLTLTLTGLLLIVGLLLKTGAFFVLPPLLII